MGLLGAIAFLTLGVCQAMKLPESWMHCPPGDGFEECMKPAVEMAIKSMAVGGLPSFGVMPLDPMHFDELVIEQPTGPVSIKLVFKNLDVTGIKDVVIRKLKGDWNQIEVETIIPIPLTLLGDYTIEGKILTLPIVGSGSCNLTFHNFEWKPIIIKFNTETTPKGKKHLHIDTIELTPDTSLLQIDLENLFNGDKILGPQMNIFLNENWREIFKELSPAVSKAFGTAYRDVGNRIFHKVPAESIMS